MYMYMYNPHMTVGLSTWATHQFGSVFIAGTRMPSARFRVGCTPQSVDRKEVRTSARRRTSKKKNKS